MGAHVDVDVGVRMDEDVGVDLITDLDPGLDIGPYSCISVNLGLDLDLDMHLGPELDAAMTHYLRHAVSVTRVSHV